jgi:peroxiredoxin Q/BCP
MGFIILILALAGDALESINNPYAFRTDDASMKVNVGSEAPDFSLNSQNNEKVTLSQFRKKKNVVLYFYPKDETPGCTKEACTFRDSYELFKDLGAEVIGVSADTAESHRAFAENHNLPFTLLSDLHNEARKLYGATSTLGLFPGRVTFKSSYFLPRKW